MVKLFSRLVTWFRDRHSYQCIKCGKLLRNDWCRKCDRGAVHISEVDGTIQQMISHGYVDV